VRNIKTHHLCRFAKCSVKAPELKELKPEKIFGEWDQKVFNSKAGIDEKIGRAWQI